MWEQSHIKYDFVLTNKEVLTIESEEDHEALHFEAEMLLGRDKQED